MQIFQYGIFVTHNIGKELYIYLIICAKERLGKINCNQDPAQTTLTVKVQKAPASVCT